MRAHGALPEDTPDPRQRILEQLRAMPVPIIGLVPQPHVEDWSSFGFESGSHDGALDQLTASITYTLWRNPDDRSDPANLAELDEETRRARDMQTPWPRPPWLLDLVTRARYPVLWEAVRTSWRADSAHRLTAAAELARHVGHILMNRHAASHPGTRPDSLIDERQIEHHVPVTVDGTVVDGVRINSDPLVFGIGADLGEQGIFTAVLDRDALPYLMVEFCTRPLDT